MATVIPWIAPPHVAPIDSPIFADGRLTLWHTPGADPVLHIDNGPEAPAATHILSPDAVRLLRTALLLTRVGVQLARAPLAVVMPLHGEPG